jgi:hypothetical protein
MCDLNSPLVYHERDPYVDEWLVPFIVSGRNADMLPTDLKERRRVLRWSEYFKVHSVHSDWLVQYVKVRYTDEYRWLVIPPVQYRWDIIRIMHEAVGHAGVQHTMANLHHHFHWCGVRADVTKYVKCCEPCQKRKLAVPAIPDLQQPVVYGLFNHLHVDLCGPFKIVPEYHRAPRDIVQAWVVIMIDYFSKCAEFGIVYEKSAWNVARCVWDNWMCRYPTPDYCTTDNGTEFGYEFSHMLARLSVQHVTTQVCHPQANGVAERLVKSFKNMLAIHINDHPINWPDALPTIRKSYMHKLHEAIGMSPLEMLVGVKSAPPIPAGDLYHAAVQLDSGVHVYHVDDALMERVDGVMERIQQQFVPNYDAWQARRKVFGCQSGDLKVGDWVLELVETPPSKIHGAVLGPFKVVGISGATVYLATGSTEFKAAKTYRRHITSLVKFFRKDSV